MVVGSAKPFIQGGQIVYSQTRNAALTRYQGAVKRASFLTGEEKKNWHLLAYFMSEKELQESERAIINEDLRRMKTRQQLQILKIKHK